MIINQAENYIKYIHFNIPKDWVVHNIPYGYMKRDGCMKSMINFKTVCGSNNINLYVLFYDGHEKYLMTGTFIHSDPTTSYLSPPRWANQ